MDSGSKRPRSPGEEASLQPNKMQRNANSRNQGDAVEISNAKASGTTSKRDLAALIKKIKPEEASIQEVLKTRDGRILVFGANPHDYNILLIASRWSTAEGIVTTKMAPRSQGGKAVVVKNVENDVSEEELLKHLRQLGFTPTTGTRLKRTSDGNSTKSIKIYIDDESQIARLTNEGFYYELTKYHVSRYTTPKFVQCFKCQKLGHLSINCTSTERYCLRCGNHHHHRDCIAAPAEYKCRNCDGNHASNDARCEKIKEAVAAYNTTSSRPTSTPPSTGNEIGAAAAAAAAPMMLPRNSNAWNNEYPTIQAQRTTTEQSNEDLKKLISEAVGTAVEEKIAHIGTVIATTMSEKFSETVKGLMEDFQKAIRRYETQIRYLEDVIKEQSKREADNNLSSTPNPGRIDAGSNSMTGPTTPAPLLSTEVTTRTNGVDILIPATKLSIQQGQSLKNIDKIIKTQIKSVAKLMERDLEEYKDEIRNKYTPFAAKPRAPRTRKTPTPAPGTAPAPMSHVATLRIAGVQTPPPQTTTDSEADSPAETRRKAKAKRKFKTFDPKMTKHLMPPPPLPHLPPGTSLTSQIASTSAMEGTTSPTQGTEIASPSTPTPAPAPTKDQQRNPPLQNAR